MSEIFQVSQVTIRRDLEYLESKGLISRYFGGAKILNAVAAEQEPQLDVLMAKKHAIVKKAAEMLEDGDTIFMNSSSTALLILSHIRNKHVTIITNNANCLTVDRDPCVDLILTGGEIYGNKKSLVGVYALNAISKVACAKCIIGVSGISADGGITSSILPETAINYAMISNTKGPKIVVADSSKVGTIQNFHSCDLSSVTHLITDTDADENELSKIRKAGVEVILVDVKTEVV